jgi:hypothetical protein
MDDQTPVVDLVEEDIVDAEEGAPLSETAATLQHLEPVIKDLEDFPDRVSEIAHHKHILDHFWNVIEHSCGVIGERNVARLCYLALTSRVLEKPVSVAVKGPSSGGKSFVTGQVLRFFPDSAYHALTAMSDKALAYSDEPLEHRFLVLFEAESLKGDMASYLMRSLLSEGCIRYETVVSSNSGLSSLFIEKPGPTGLLVTTVAASLHPECLAPFLCTTLL